MKTLTVLEWPMQSYLKWSQYPWIITHSHHIHLIQLGRTSEQEFHGSMEVFGVQRARNTQGVEMFEVLF